MGAPRLLDLFCGAGGAAMGYSRAGFEVVGVDVKAQKNYPFEFVQADAMTFPLEGFDAIHASPPCQGYSIMNNLPWIRARDYPLLIKATRDRLDATGLPYIIENVAGARFGAIGLLKRGIADHGLKAGWLCGGMFGLPIYRHRYFETNWFWIQPGHPKHVRTRQPESSFSPRPRGVWEKAYEEANPGRSAQAAKGYSPWRRGHDGQGALTAAERWPGVGEPGQRGIHKPEDVDLRRRQHLTERLPGTNGAQKEGVAVGHAAGWRIAAEAMGIGWMKRDELTQAIPPVMTEYIGLRLIEVL